MRILLAAMNARKDDPDGNLARHLAALEQARLQGCQLAVFPEFSLTGSVDPRRHPGRALAVDAEPVRALLEGTSRTGVAAVFGIAERDQHGAQRALAERNQVGCPLSHGLSHRGRAAAARPDVGADPIYFRR